MDSQERVVIKPLDAMAGRSVFVTGAGDPNANVILEEMTRRGTRTVIAQRYLPAVLDTGDTRILLVNGEPCVRCAGAHPHRWRLPREPRGGRARRAGGSSLTASAGSAPRSARRCANAALHFVGIDVIDGWPTEINVTSPTGIRQIDRHFGLNVAGLMFERWSRAGGGESDPLVRGWLHAEAEGGPWQDDRRGLEAQIPGERSRRRTINDFEVVDERGFSALLQAPVRQQDSAALWSAAPPVESPAKSPARGRVPSTRCALRWSDSDLLPQRHEPRIAPRAARTPAHADGHDLRIALPRRGALERGEGEVRLAERGMDLRREGRATRRRAATQSDVRSRSSVHAFLSPICARQHLRRGRRASAASRRTSRSRGAQRRLRAGEPPRRAARRRRRGAS